MARQHRDRYANMADIIADLDRLERGLLARGPHPGFDFHRFVKTTSRAVAATVGVFVLTGALVLGYKAVNGNYFLETVSEFAPPAGTGWAETQIGDWDGDGEPDLVRVNGRKLEAFSSAGQAVRSVPIGNPDNIGLFLGLLADITGDGMEEAFVCWNRFTNAHLAAFNQLGWPVREFSFGGSLNVHPQHGTNYTRLYPLRVTDLDGDGSKELLVAVTSTWALQPRGLACFDLSTTRLKWFFATANLIVDVIECDLDGDNRREIIVGGNSPSNGCVLPDGTDDSHASTYAVSSTGNLLWHRPMAGAYARVTPVTRNSATNKTAVVWVAVSHAYNAREGQPEAGKVVEFDANGKIVHEQDFGVELTSVLALDLPFKRELGYLVADRLGNLHLLDENLLKLQTVALEQVLFTEVQVQLLGAANFGFSGDPHILLTSCQVERKFEPHAGNSLELVENVFFHSNRIVVLDSSLRPVASRMISPLWTSLNHPNFRAKKLQRTTNSQDILVLELNARVLRLKRGPVFGFRAARPAGEE